MTFPVSCENETAGCLSPGFITAGGVLFLLKVLLFENYSCNDHVMVNEPDKRVWQGARMKTLNIGKD